MKNRTMVALLATLLAGGAAAHPGVGIVVDKAGNVFFTDLKQVWRLSPDGVKTIAVPSVHTHELYLDAGETLWGEHLWYEGERVDRWGHYVWSRGGDGGADAPVSGGCGGRSAPAECRRADGRVTREPPREGFLEGRSFVRDASGAMYWAAGKSAADGVRTRVLRRSPEGTISTLAAGFTRVSYLTARPDGTLFVVDDGTLYRVTADGRRARLAGGLAGRSALSFLGRHHASAGLTALEDGSVLVANPGRRRVVRVAPDGRLDTLVTSPAPYSPWGVAARGDTVYVLKWSYTTARVRAFGRDGLERARWGRR